jgi:hypothetical protein
MLKSEERSTHLRTTKKRDLDWTRQDINNIGMHNNFGIDEGHKELSIHQMIGYKYSKIGT